MAQTTSLVFNGGVIPSPSPDPAGNGKAKLLKIGEITVTEQEVQVTKNVICDPDSVTTVAPFMEVLTSARLAELISANSILVLDDGTVQYLMADATVVVEDGTSVCTAVNFLGLSKENRAKVLYPCTRITDELTLQQVLEVGEPVETNFDFVKAYPEDTEAGTLIDKLEIEDTIDDDHGYQPLLEIHPADGKVAINEDGLHEVMDELGGAIDSIVDTIYNLDVDSVPHAYLHSTLAQSAGDSSTTSTPVNIFAQDALEGDCFEFEQTTTIDDTPFGYVWIEPGTYLINASVTLQWVGNPRGTFVAKVGYVMGENFDFSQEQEIKRNTTKVVTIPSRMKLAVNVTYDAGTPVMGFWVQSMQVVKLAGGMSQTNIIHDDTLVGRGTVADTLGVNEAKVAQSTLAGNIAPEFVPNETTTVAGMPYMYSGSLYIAKEAYYGPWDASKFKQTTIDNLFALINNRLYTNHFIESGISRNGIVKDFYINFKKGDVINYKFTVNGTADMRIYLVKSLDPLSFVSVNPAGNYYIVDDDGFYFLRIFAVSYTDSYDIDFEFAINNKGVKALNDSISSLQTNVTKNLQSVEYDTKPWLTKISFQKSDIPDSNGKIQDFPINADLGDVLKFHLTKTTAFRSLVYLLVDEGTYKQVSDSNSTVVDVSFKLDRGNYKTLRLYHGPSIGNPNSDISFEYSFIGKELADVIESQTKSNLRTYTSYYSESGIDKNGVLKAFDVDFKKGELLSYNYKVTGTVELRLYLVKTLDPLVYITIPNDKNCFVINDDGYTLLRVYAISHTGSYSVDFEFSLNNSGVSRIEAQLSEINKSIPSPSDLQMCLPDKVYAVKGLPYNIYGESIMLNSMKNVDIFVQPRSTNNFAVDTLQIGKVCKLDNILSSYLRIGFEDYIARNSRLIYKDLTVVWKNAPSGITRNCLIIGDSITNRGAGNFAKQSANFVGATINGYGTMTNQGNFLGEGREGWTWANFIGKSNICGSGAITPMGSGTSGSLVTNPFLRLATAEDKINYPDFCFTSTGVKNESSYSDDPSQTDYYIFDFEHYLDRFSPSISLDVITIALGTNDVLRGYATETIIEYAEFMIQRIRSAMPSIRIGVLPSPAWGMTYTEFASVVVPYIEAMKVLAESENFDIVGLWCFMSRCHSFGVDTDNVTAINASTNSATYADNIHFDTKDGKYAYMEYGKVLASYILN